MSSDRRDELYGALLAPSLWAQFEQDITDSIAPELWEEALQGMRLVQAARPEDADWRAVSERLYAWAEEQARAMARQINETSRKLVQDAIDRYLADGGAGDIGPYLQDIATPDRATLIGDDQHAIAFNQGIAQAAEAVGVHRARWVTSGESNVCPACAANEGKEGDIAALLAERSGIHHGTSINCACSLSPIFT